MSAGPEGSDKERNVKSLIEFFEGSRRSKVSAPAPVSTPPPQTPKSNGKDEFEKERLLWSKFEGKPPIPGFRGNFIAVFLENENEGELGADYYSKMSPETELGKEVTRYLANNGVTEVTMVCNFQDQMNKCYESYAKPSGQNLDLNLDQDKVPVDCLDLPMDLLAARSPSPENVPKAQLCNKDEPTTVLNVTTDVTVIVLLPVVGRWQHKKIYDLVQHSLKTSRIGIIILADNSVTLDVNEPHWKELLGFIRTHNLFSNSLELVCGRHQRVSLGITSAPEFRFASPGSGCRMPCGMMSCGHECPYRCHPQDPGHTMEALRCNRKCLRRCRAGHPCLKKCWEDCGECYFVVVVDPTCSHVDGQKQMFCYEVGSQKCQIPVRKEFPCGHPITLGCSEDVTQYKCKVKNSVRLPCDHQLQMECSGKAPDPSSDSTPISCSLSRLTTLPCGHVREVKCSNAAKQLQLPCTEPCGKILQCGHACPRPCHSDDRKHKKIRCLEPCSSLCPRGLHFCETKRDNNDHLCGEPCDPCGARWEVRLPCGHVLVTICSAPEVDLENYTCTETCSLERPFCGHRCHKKCYEDCGMCEELVERIPAGCTRNHRVKLKCQEVDPGDQCTQLVRDARVGSCGHYVPVRCSDVGKLSDKQVSLMCRKPCNAIFKGERECNHKCKGHCNLCYQGRFHLRCSQPCLKRLVCGHNCSCPCSMVCRPCSRPCEVSCEHRQCPYECGVPCELECDEACSYSCAHSSCSNKCSEVCNKPLCSGPCPLTLACGHPCIGYCGEKCPPYCRRCEPHKLIRISALTNFNEDSSETNSEEDGELDTDRFIYLENCGHCIEASDLEQWIKVRVSSSQEVLPLNCPYCQKRLKWLHRFSRYFHENRKLIWEVRRRIFGDMEEITGILDRVKEKLNLAKVEIGCPFDSGDYGIPIIEEMDFDRLVLGTESYDMFESMDIKKAQFLDWLADEYIEVCDILQTFTGLEPRLYNFLRGRFELYLKMIFNGRYWPLHPNELLAAQRERLRLDDSAHLYRRILLASLDVTKNFINTSIGAQMVKGIELVLWKELPYTEEIRQEFQLRLKELECALHSTLNVSETERRDIVKAFGERAGRWFKCQNGHLYVITECGGATEVSLCHECGVPVGGINHQMLPHNYLANEMDGADQPMWSTALDRDAPGN